jgi:hypothetical protein
MKTRFILILVVGSMLLGCGEIATKAAANDSLKAYGHWITKPSGQVMVDPQPSGLKYWRGGLLTLSDRSAAVEHRLRLRQLSTAAQLVDDGLPMVLSTSLLNSCFAAYLGDNPDLEALAVDPQKDTVFYVVTEDASYSSPMSKACQLKYADTGSTDYPILLIRLELLADNQLTMTHVRPIQFQGTMQIGDFPNDGIEALAFGQDRQLYLGIEKDKNKQARLFSLTLNDTFWQSQEFAPVSELAAKLPLFEHGNHPINGMDYYQTDQGAEFLLVAARNDESLWIVDLAAQKEAKIIAIDFYAEIATNSDGCEAYESMDNASIEGVAVVEQTLWLVNDPWKAVYLNNIQCPQNRENFQQFAPLLFSLPIQSAWFE